MSDDADMKPVSSSEEKEVSSKQESKQQDKDNDKDKDQHIEQEKEKEQKTKTPRKKKETTAVTPRSDRPQRERKSVDHWQPEANEAFRKDFEVEEGAGTPLGEIDNVKRRLEATKATESEVKKLHSILFPGAGKGNATKDVVKKHIRQFSGFPGSSAEKEKAHDAAKEKLEKIELKTLKAIAGILDVGISGSRPEIASRIADFLNKPKSSGHAYQAKVRSTPGSSKGSKKKGTKRKGSTKGEKTGKKKRTKNSFMIFRADVYDEMKEKYPDLKITELASKIGEKWRGLSADKKKKYEDKAAKLKAEASDAEDDDEKPAKKAKKSSSKKKVSPKKKKAPAKKKGKKEESEDDDEEEEEEENEDDDDDEDDEEEAEEAETEEDKKVKLELSLAISDIIQKADLTSMSLKKVREQLTADTAFGEEIVNKKKDIIKQLVTDAVQAKQKLEKQKEKDKDADQDGDKEMEDKAEKAQE